MGVLTFYYAPRTCSFATHCVLNELNVPFEGRRVDLQGGEQHASAFRRLNHLGRVPVLMEGDWVLTESLAILQYVADAYDGQHLIPSTVEQRAVQSRWFAYLSSTVHPYFGASLRPERFASDEGLRGHVSAVARERFADEMRWVESQLTHTGFVLGDLPHLIDFYLLVFLRWASVCFDVPTELPNSYRQIQRMLTLPSVVKTLEDEGVPLFLR